MIFIVFAFNIVLAFAGLVILIACKAFILEEAFKELWAEFWEEVVEDFELEDGSILGLVVCTGVILFSAIIGVLVFLFSLVYAVYVCLIKLIRRK